MTKLKGLVNDSYIQIISATALRYLTLFVRPYKEVESFPLHQPLGLRMDWTYTGPEPGNSARSGS